MATIQYSPEAVRYMQHVFPWAHPCFRRKRHLDSFSSFLQGSLSYRLTDRPTNHATRSVSVGGAHSGEDKFGYCLWSQQVFIAEFNRLSWPGWLTADGLPTYVVTRQLQVSRRGGICRTGK